MGIEYNFIGTFIGFVILIFIIVWLLQPNKKKKIQKVLSKEKNLKFSHQYISSFNNTAIAIDSQNKKILFYDNEKIILVNFNDLISVETQINDETLSITKRGSQLQERQ